MPIGVVLVIEDDEWVSRLLAAGIRQAGYEVVCCDTAEAGFAAACASEPDCIVCDIDLPGQDGYWVARSVRTHPTRVSVTPFLFLSGLDDPESRLEGFQVGADVYMTKPFRVEEVVAQIGALVQMASRLRQGRDSLLSIPPPGETAIEGDLAHMSIATVLTVLEMERRSGTFEVTSKKRRAQLELAGGSVLYGIVGGTQVSALAALRAVLSWRVGRFAFTPGFRDAPSSRKPISAYLLEATRLEDEGARAELELPPSKRRPEHRLSLTSIGGPPSGPIDLAPPSSRGPLDLRLRRAAAGAPPETIELRSAPADESEEVTLRVPMGGLVGLTLPAANPDAARPRSPTPPPPASKAALSKPGTPLPAPVSVPRPAPQRPPRPDSGKKR